ncbi:hypothetical protein [Streptomyces platensis]|uniref:hypothetical protein n=1 Tax=Streptomyces platensis TaxID=58346 RepID=UPI001F3911EC|nr:hypothetical protein [Streptomyces platensis]MCF3144921.1 hypothetical protein [Streptomyces platensis]
MERESTGPVYGSFALTGAMTWAGPAFIMLRRLLGFLASVPNQMLITTSEQVKRMSVWEWGSQAIALTFAFLLFALFCVMIVTLILWPFWWAFRIVKGASPQSLAGLRRYRVIATAASAIRSCAQIQQSRGVTARAELLESLLQQVETLEPLILRAYLTPGNPARSARRRRSLSEHAGRVAARLQEVELRIEHEPRTAIPELANLLLTIQERCAEGRVGVLLDADEIADEKLKGFSPVRQRKRLLRLTVAILLTIAGAVGIAQTDLPDVAEGPAVLLVAILASALVYRAPEKVEERAQYIIGQ